MIYIFNSIIEIEGNAFNAINGRGIYFKGACNTIQRNKFQNWNSASNSYSDIQTQTVTHNNNIVDNLGTINAGSRTKIQLFWTILWLQYSLWQPRKGRPLRWKSRPERIVLHVITWPGVGRFKWPCIEFLPCLRFPLDRRQYPYFLGFRYGKSICHKTN